MVSLMDIYHTRTPELTVVGQGNRRRAIYDGKKDRRFVELSKSIEGARGTRDRSRCVL